MYRIHPHLCSIAAAVVALGIGATAPAQQQPGEQPDISPAGQAERSVEVIALSHSESREIASTIQRVLREADITPDQRTNSLIVRATADTMASVKELVGVLDVEAAGGEQTAKQVRSYPLSNIEADQMLVATISSLLRSSEFDRGALQIALDPSQNQLIASGREEYLSALSRLVETLDKPAKPEAEAIHGELSVRILWLVGGDSGATRDVPEDLAPVTEQLARYGISGLNLAAQSIVRVSANEEFANSFLTSLDEAWHLRVEGRVRSQPEGVRLDIQVLAEPAPIPFDPRAQPRQAVDRSTTFRTSITTTSGHFVVLSMNPIGDMDSVYVLQVNEAE